MIVLAWNVGKDDGTAFAVDERGNGVGVNDVDLGWWLYYFVVVVLGKIGGGQRRRWLGTLEIRPPNATLHAP